jgi:hypothetical protein
MGENARVIGAFGPKSRRRNQRVYDGADGGDKKVAPMIIAQRKSKTFRQRERFLPFLEKALSDDEKELRDSHRQN